MVNINEILLKMCLKKFKQIANELSIFLWG